MDKSELNQSKHFDKLYELYELHYDGKYSQKYRNCFIHRPLFRDIDLRNKTILEAMSGSGQTTEYLISRKPAKIIGLDISKRFVERYKKRWGDNCDTVCQSILETKFPDNYFDIVVIISGLHHLHPNVQKGIDEVRRILKKGGYFCFMEPHKQSFFDFFRKIWYHFDRIAERNEQAIDLKSMRKQNKEQFNFEKEEYDGGIGYYLIFNSMVLRIHPSLKKYYSDFLILIDKITKPLMTRFTSSYVLCRWKKQ